MSAMKAYQADSVRAREGALAAAVLPTASDRMRELTRLFQVLGEASNGYADPRASARALVKIACGAYRYMRELEREGSRV